MVTLLVIIFQAIHAESGDAITLQKNRGHATWKKSIVHDIAVDQFDGNNGPPLDQNNKLKKVKNQRKKTGKLPESVKKRTGRLVNRAHHLLKVKDYNVTSSVESEAGTMMEISTVGKDLVTIRGVGADKYICMNGQNGQMFARASPNDDCIFREYLEGNFHSTFRLNNENSPWFIAIDSNGKFMLKVTKKLDFSTFFQLIS